MVLKPEKEFLRQAFTNNSFGNRETELSLRAVLDNSFSYLYRLQRNLIQYEEYFYTTRNQVYTTFASKSRGENPEMGDFYLDDHRRVCADFPVELIPSIRREEYRRTQVHNNDNLDPSKPEFYGKEITYQEMVRNEDIFKRIPILIIDDQVLLDFKVRIYDDHFVVIFPFDQYFMYDKKYNHRFDEYHFTKHEYTLQIINNTNSFDKIKKDKNIGFFDIKTNASMLNVQATKYDKPFGFISNEYMKSLCVAQYKEYSCDNLRLYKEEKGLYFATIYQENQLFGTNLIEVEVTDDGVLLNMDIETIRLLNSYGTVKIRFIFYRYLKKYKTMKGETYIKTHEMEGKTVLSDDNKLYSDVFIIHKDGEEPHSYPQSYDMPIPTEDLIIFRKREETDPSSIKSTRSLISNEKVTCFYPYLYQIENEKEVIYREPELTDINNQKEKNRFYYTEDGKCYDNYDQYTYTEDITLEELKEKIHDRKLIREERYLLRNIQPGDEVSIFYFYYPGYDLHYTNMYHFFYRYLYFKWGFGSSLKLTMEEIINGILFGTITIANTFNVNSELMEELVVLKKAIINLKDSYFETKEFSSITSLFLGSSYVLNDKEDVITIEECDYTDEEKMSIVCSRFLEVFELITRHNIVNYVYDDIDYLKTLDDDDIILAKKMTPLEYRVKRLKEFIADDPEALRKYILCQNKVSIKYDFFADKKMLRKRLRYESEGNNPKRFQKTIYRNTEDNSYYDVTGRYFTEENEYDYTKNITRGELALLFADHKVQEEIIDEPMYMFVFERLNRSDFLSCRIFIDGFLYTNFIQKEYQYQDYIYIPTWVVPENVFIEIETFPTYHETDIVTFTEDSKSVIVEYPEKEGIKPTLSDLFFRDPHDDKEYYDEDDFKLEYISSTHNYYTEPKNKITVYSFLEEKNYFHDALVDLTTEHYYIPFRYSDERKKKNTKKYMHFDSSGKLLDVMSEDDIPANLSKKAFVTEIYRNTATGDYYAKDFSYTTFFMYDRNGEKISGDTWTKEELLPIIKRDSLVLEFDKIYQVKYGEGYYTEEGQYYTFKGQRDRSCDVPSYMIEQWIRNGEVASHEVYATSDLLPIIRDRDYYTYDRVLGGETTIHRDNTNMNHTPMVMVKITLLNDELLNREIEISVRKDSIFQFDRAKEHCYPCFEIGIRNQSIQIERYVDPHVGDYYEKDTYYSHFYHYNSRGYRDEFNKDGSNIAYTRKQIKEQIYARDLVPYIDPGSTEFIRVFRNGRLLSKNRYEVLLNDGIYNYGYPRVQLLERVMEGSNIVVDVTPYRNRLIFYQHELESNLVDLTGYINKPFDVRYYDVYLNGRRISRNNIFPVSPFTIRLAGIHSIHNLAIYEKDRDWEYYGCDMNNYYTFTDLANEIFMEKDIKDKVVDDITGKVPDDHICEEEEDWERDLNYEAVSFEIFYYNRLLPLILANADESMFNQDDIHENFPIIYRLFFRYNEYLLKGKDYTPYIGSLILPDDCILGTIIGEDDHIIQRYKLNEVDYIIIQKKIGSEYKNCLYIGTGINNITKRLVFDDDFPCDENEINILYENGIYVISTTDTNVYYWSNDGVGWHRGTFTFISDNRNCICKPYISAFLNNRFVMIGEILTSHDEFVNYGFIDSEDGETWTYQTNVSYKYANKGEMKYLHGAHVIYSSNGRYDFYSTDGVHYAPADITMHDFKMREDATFTSTIGEVGPMYYAGKRSLSSEDFNYMVISSDGINWHKLHWTGAHGDLYYCNKMYLLCNEESETIKKFYCSPDLSSITPIEIVKPYLDPEVFSGAKGFYFIDKKKYNNAELFFVKKSTIDFVSKEGNNVLLLDPDVYYEGEDEDRWNVYETWNENDFIDKLIKEEDLKKE